MAKLNKIFHCCQTHKLPWINQPRNWFLDASYYCSVECILPVQVQHYVLLLKDLVASWDSVGLSMLSWFSNWFIMRMGSGGTLGVKMALTSAQPGLRSLAPPFAAWFSNYDSIECRPCRWMHTWETGYILFIPDKRTALKSHFPVLPRAWLHPLVESYPQHEIQPVLK